MHFTRGTALLYVLTILFAVGLLVLVMLFTRGLQFLEQEGEGPLMEKEEELLELSPAEIESTTLKPETLVGQADLVFAQGLLAEAALRYERALTLAGSGEEQWREWQESGGDVRVMRKLYDTAVLSGNRERAEWVLGLLSFRGIPSDSLQVLRGFLHLREGDIEGAKALFSEGTLRSENAYGLLVTALLNGAYEELPNLMAVVRETSDPFLQFAVQAVQGAEDEFALFRGGKVTHRQTLHARALAETRQCPSAVLILQNVVRTDPKYRDAWIVLGYCQLAMEDPEGALSSFESAHRLDPEKAETQYFLGLTHERLGHDLEANMFLGYALKNRFQPSRVIREKLAAHARTQGAFAEARDHYLEILKEDGKGDAALYHALVSLLLDDLGENEQAYEIAKRAREELGDVPAVLDINGWAALENDQLNEAATFLSVAVQQDPSLASAWYHRGLLEIRSEQPLEAIVSFRKAYELSLGIDQELAAASAAEHNALLK